MSYKSIGLKFILVAGVVVTVFSGFVLYRTWSQSNHQMQQLLAGQSELALQFDLAIRQYVAESVRPFAEHHLDEGEFVPEVMSTSFAARSIFEKVRKKFPDYVLKFSSDNPRNPSNRAGPKELEMIKYFNDNPQVKEWSGQINLNGKEHLAHFHTRRMEESCLGCHGDPQDAPKALRQRYGDKAGFHRPVGDVIALDTVAIPVDMYRAAAFAQTKENFISLLIGLGLLLAGIYCVFHVLVRRKLARISAHFKQALDSQSSSLIAPISYQGGDEIGELARSFNKMAEDLQRTTTSVGDLNKEIADRKKAEERLQDNVKELEQFNQLAVGRELKMIELKEQVNELLRQLGRAEEFPGLAEATDAYAQENKTAEQEE
jgi:HAMP domain-containing protein